MTSLAATPTPAIPAAEAPQPDPRLALALSTVAFAISFALWGMLAPLARTFQQSFGLTEQQTWMLIAVPVLLGSVMRLPMGMLADRYGGRRVFSALLLFTVLPALFLSFASSYTDLLLGGLLLGMAGTSFSVGVAFTSRHFPPGQQGLALGIYGAGNIGQSVALFLIPILAASLGWPNAFRLFSLVALAWAVVFWLAARDAAVVVRPRPFSAMLRVIVDRPLSWLLSLFYFVTFGGFVALSIGLPKMLQEMFSLTPTDAGMRVAGFVLVATLVRPLGGWLSDRFGGARVLAVVFSAAGALALGMAFHHIVPFTVGALGVGAAIGIGNGAVFKLVPQHFPDDTGTVTGLVGAMGGLGGFFPPLALGIIKAHTGSYALGFVLLTAFCAACLVLDLVFLVRRGSTAPSRPGGPPPRMPGGSRKRTVVDLDPLATAWAAGATIVLVLAIYLGSGRLEHFDAALIAYTSATVFACFGIVYRYAIWLQKPPTALYWRRGWQIFLEPRHLPRRLRDLASLLVKNIGLQLFIAGRSQKRWIAHLLISWGCLSAAAITFPLVFGWVHFEADPANPVAYQVFVLGLQAGTLPSTSIVGWLTFHALDFSAIAILVAFPLIMARRMGDHGAMGVQQFGMDLLPLLMLFSISVTGLMLTASTLWMHGHSYSFIALLHAFTVIVTLLYLPFGKFFHIFQRPANLGVAFYKQAGEEGEQAACARCGDAFASRMHVEDLQRVLDELGLDQRLEGDLHYQQICPGCRRRLLATRQLEAIGGPGFL